MNLYRFYCEDVCIEDFTPQEAKNIGRILLEISALTLGEQGLEREEYDRRIYTYGKDGLTAQIVEYWDDEKRREATAYRLVCNIGNKDIMVFEAEQYNAADRPEYYIHTCRDMSAWPEHLHQLAATSDEVKEFEQNFSPLSFAELAFK